MTLGGGAETAIAGVASDAVTIDVETAPRSEWRDHWPLVLSATAGLSFGGMPAASLGLFMAPLRDEFGWSSAQVAAGMTLMAAIGLFLAPLAGAVLDRTGSRRVAIPGLAASGVVFAAFGFMTGHYLQWVLIWVGLSLAMLFIRTMVWNRAVSTAFTTTRGLALAVLLTGLALGQVIVPPLANMLIANWGWRAAYVALGLGWTTMALIPVIFFFKERGVNEKAVKAVRVDAPATPLPGLTLQQALRDPAMIKIAVATALQTGVAAAIAIHFVPLLVSLELDRTTAASMAAVLGLCSICGKLLNGWLIDRYSSGLIPFIAFSSPALAYVLLLQGQGSLALITMAAMVAGYAGGAALHMTNYLSTRYAGLGHFGKIFGVVSSLMGLAAGISPLLAGIVFDRTGSYDLVLFTGIPLAIVAGVLVASLGRYPDFNRT